MHSSKYIERVACSGRTIVTTCCDSSCYGCCSITGLGSNCTCAAVDGGIGGIADSIGDSSRACRRSSSIGHSTACISYNIVICKAQCSAGLSNHSIQRTSGTLRVVGT